MRNPETWKTLGLQILQVRERRGRSHRRESANMETPRRFSMTQPKCRTECLGKQAVSASVRRVSGGGGGDLSRTSRVSPAAA